jgi:hypothetical protein
MYPHTWTEDPLTKKRRLISNFLHAHILETARRHLSDTRIFGTFAMVLLDQP